MGSNVVNFLTECSPRTQETTLLSSSCNSIEDDLRFELPSVANVGSFLSKLSAEAFARYCVTREDGFRNWQDWNIYPFAATRAIFSQKTVTKPSHFATLYLPTCQLLLKFKHQHVPCLSTSLWAWRKNTTTCDGFEAHFPHTENHWLNKSDVSCESPDPLLMQPPIKHKCLDFSMSNQEKLKYATQ